MHEIYGHHKLSTLPFFFYFHRLLPFFTNFTVGECLQRRSEYIIWVLVHTAKTTVYCSLAKKAQYQISAHPHIIASISSEGLKFTPKSALKRPPN